MSYRQIFLKIIIITGLLLLCVAIMGNTQSKKARSIWPELSKALVLNHAVDHKLVAAERERLLSRKWEIDQLIRRAEPYLHYIFQEVSKRKLPAEIALIPLIESAFDPFAYSRQGAAGLWQFMPGTGSGFGLVQNFWYDGRRDIRAATQAKLNYLTYLNKRFAGDWALTLAASNAGEGYILRAMKRNKQRNKATDYFSLTLPKETTAHIPKLYALADIIKNAKRYGVILPFIANQPYFVEVAVGKQIDLTYAAALAEMHTYELHSLNPEHNYWITRPDGPHTLLLPVSQLKIFQRNLEKLDGDLIEWHKYLIKSGDTLNSIAKKFDIPVEFIRLLNNLHQDHIIEGKKLLIPQKKLASTNPRVKQFWRNSAKRIKNGRGPKRVTHTVSKGDNIRRLAAKYRTRPEAIVYWNRLSSVKTTLNIGDKIIIWQERKQQGTRRVQYTVKAGDSLSRIAKRYGVKISDIKNWNQLTTQKYIYPGQSLIIYS